MKLKMSTMGVIDTSSLAYEEDKEKKRREKEKQKERKRKDKERMEKEIERKRKDKERMENKYMETTVPPIILEQRRIEAQKRKQKERQRRKEKEAKYAKRSKQNKYGKKTYDSSSDDDDFMGKFKMGKSGFSNGGEYRVKRSG